jgi:hypothetical protein
MASAANVRAQPIDESLHREGVALRRERRDAEALAVFERALAVDGSARTRAQVGLAEEALGLWVEAEREVSAALAAGQGPWFQEHGEDLRAALDTIRSRLGTLEVRSKVESTEIWIDGRQDASWPWAPEMRVVAGDIVIEARAPGFITQNRTIHVAAGERAVAEFQLVPSSVSTARTGSSADASEGTPVATTHAVPGRSSLGDVARPAAIASLAGGLVLIAGGSVALAIRNSNAAIYNDDARCFYGGLTRDERCGSYRTAASTAGDLAIAQFGVAAAALATSGVLFGLAKKTRVAVGNATCSVGMGFACIARF